MLYQNQEDQIKPEMKSTAGWFLSRRISRISQNIFLTQDRVNKAKLLSGSKDLNPIYNKLISLILILLESTILIFLMNPQFLLAFGIYNSPAPISHVFLFLGFALTIIILAWLYASKQYMYYSRADLGLTRGFLPDFMVNNIFAIFTVLCIIYFGPMIFYSWSTTGCWTDLLLFFIYSIFFVPCFDELIFRGYLLHRYLHLFENWVPSSRYVATTITAFYYALWKIPLGLTLAFGIPPLPVSLAALTFTLGFIASILLAIFRLRTNSLLLSFTLHSITTLVFNLIPLLTYILS